MLLFYSDYADICTIINDMDHQNWGFGFLRNISREIKAMFSAQNIDVTHCPFSAGAIHIGKYSLHLPKLPSGLGALASLAKVSSTGLHDGNTPMQHTAIFHDNFHLKFFDYFLMFAQNIDCRYTLEPPQ